MCAVLIYCWETIVKKVFQSRLRNISVINQREIKYIGSLKHIYEIICYLFQIKY